MKTPWRSLLRPRARLLSSEASAADFVPPPHPTTFRSPIVEELYFKLIDLPKEELQHVSRVVLARVDVDVDQEIADQEAFIAAGGGTGAVAAAEVEEAAPAKTNFDVKLLGFDAKSKIKVIKEVRAVTGLGLKEAKDLVEGAPKVIKKDLKQEEADELKAKLVEIGAEIEVV